MGADLRGLLSKQAMKLCAAATQALQSVAELRGLWEKVGCNRNSAVNTRSFGFNHHSEFDTLNSLLQVGFNFRMMPMQAAQRRRDAEAFLLCFDTGIGRWELESREKEESAPPYGRISIASPKE